MTENDIIHLHFMRNKVSVTRGLFLVLVVLLQQGGTLFLMGAAQPPANMTRKVPEAAAYIQDEILVCFDASLSARSSRARFLHLSCGAALKREFKLVPGMASVTLPSGLTVPDALARLKGNKGIRFAQPNYIYHPQTIPNDPRFSEQWGLNNTGQSAGMVPGIDIRALNAWNRTTGSSNVIVAVVDSGVEYTHEDLEANMWVNPQEIEGNGLDDDGNGFVDDVHGMNVVDNNGIPMDSYGHGTFCAGIIGSVGNNGKGGAGVCWNIKIMALKFASGYGEGGTSDHVIRCFEYAAMNGAKIINFSWGLLSGSSDPGLKSTIDAVRDAGLICVFPAGNENGVDIDIFPVYPASYDSANIISVMSFGASGARSLHSNYGLQSVDIAAPGSAILGCSLGSGYAFSYGTSFATAHISGACALLYALNPQLDWRQVKQIIMDTAERSDALSGLCRTGGRLNLSRAVSRVIPQEWLVAHGFATDGSAEGGDADLDGMSNRDEWLAGTDPTNRLSLLQFESSTLLANTNFKLRWQSVPGKRYWVGSSDAFLADMAFVPFVTNIVGAASQTEYVDTRPATTSRYYRVGVHLE